MGSVLCDLGVAAIVMEQLSTARSKVLADILVAGASQRIYQQATYRDAALEN